MLLANSIPFVATCICAKPMSWAALIISMNFGCIVGSPPENWTAGVGTGRWSLRTWSIFTIVLKSGSNTYPAWFALAKQIGQRKLHLLVRSTFARPVWLRCRLQRPHSKGHTFAFLIAGSFTPTPSLAHFSTLRYISTSDQTTSLNFPCFGHDFSITTFPFSLRIVAGMIVRHSGQRLSVFFGSPFGIALCLVSM